MKATSSFFVLKDSFQVITPRGRQTTPPPSPPRKKQQMVQICIVGTEGSTNGACKVEKCAQSGATSASTSRGGNPRQVPLPALPRDGTGRDGDHVNPLSALPPSPLPPRAPTAPLHLAPLSTHLALHFHGVAVHVSQRLRLVETSVHLRRGGGGTEAQQAAVRAAFAHRKRGSGFPAPEIPSLPRPGWRTLAVRLCRLADASFFRSSVRSGRREEGLRGATRGARLAASTLECQSKFWNDISPPKKNGILWGVQARLGIPAPSPRLALKHGEVRGEKTHRVSIIDDSVFLDCSEFSV